MPATDKVLPTGTAQQPRSMANSQGSQARPAASPVVTVVTAEPQADKQGALTDRAEESLQSQAARGVLTDPVEEKAHRLAALAPEGVKAPLVVRVTEGSKGTRANAGK